MTNSTPDPLIGRTVSQYEIQAKLGGGGMGVVYRARDVKLGRAVALKFLPPEWSHDEGAKQRFMREAQAASATNQRNICVIHNIEETDDGRLFIVMACYEGETLKQRLERGALPIGEAIEIASEVAEGLAKAHAQGVVHRDVKPGNLMLTDDGVKILDFGLAKFADALQLTAPGSTVGTVAYMSPEQVRGAEADARSDVWALGVVMYEMLAGALPFRGVYPEATFHAIKHEPVPSLRAARPDLPESLERIVMRCLEKDPFRRFPSAREPARDLRLLAGRTVPLELRTEEVPTLAAFRGELPRRKSWFRRALTPVRLAGVVALVAALSAGGYYWTTRPVERIRVAVVPVANHTGNAGLDQYRLSLTSALIDEVSESSNIRVVPYLRLAEMVRPFMARGGDVSSNDAVEAIATESAAPFLIVPTLLFRDRDSTWVAQIQVRNAETGTNVATYETAPVTSSLSQQTAFRLIAAAAERVQQHFKDHGPGRSFQQRAAASRFQEPDAARAFVEGLNQYDQLEYSLALAAFTESAKLEGQHPLPHAWLSRVLLILNRKTEAVASAQTARTLIVSETSKTDAAFVNAVLAECQNDMEAAEKAYRELAALEPDDPWGRAELADFLKRRPDRNQPAIEAYHDLLRLDETYIKPHVELCQLYTRLDDHPLAEKEAQTALARYRARGATGGEAQALLCLGDAEREQAGSHLADARRNIEAARSLIASAGQPYNLSRAVFYKGLVEYSDGQLQDAARLFEEAAPLAHDAGNRLTEGTALLNVAVTSQRLGQPTRAVDFYRRSRAVYQQLGDERRVAETDVNAAAVQVDYDGNPEEARRMLTNARANLEKLGHVDFQLVAMQSEADSYRYGGSLDVARTLLQKGLAMARDRQLTSKTTDLSLALARAHTQAGDYSAALETLGDLVHDDDRAGEEDALIEMGTVATRLGDFDRARGYLNRALTEITARKLVGLLPAAHLALGALAHESGQGRAASSEFALADSAWTDPLPNAAGVEARCAGALELAILGNRETARRDLEAGLAAAAGTGRLSLEAMCRARLARVNMMEGRRSDALAVLRRIPDDTSERMIGAETRAHVEYWRGLASDEPAARAAIDRAREALEQVQRSVPQEFRDRFAARPEIHAILDRLGSANP